MKILLALLGVAAFHLSSSQKVVDVNRDHVSVGDNVFYIVGGQPFVNVKFVSLVEGTPYFRDEWMKANITMPGGTEYKDVSVRLDLFDNELHYLDAKNTELVSSTPVKQINIADGGDKVYRFVHSSFLEAKMPKAGWYQVLSDGAATLYKSFSKTLSENKPYGSATTEQTIRTTETYLVYYNAAVLEIKKIRDAPAVLANKQKEIETFLKEKDDKKKTMDERFLALIDYYNSIIK